MRDGLYKVQFNTPLGEGYGVVTLDGGRLRGGDSMMFYTGSYQVNGNQFDANVQTNVHSPQAGMASVLGTGTASLTLTGNFNGDSGTMKGSSPQAPNIPFSATLTRIAD